MIEHAPRFHHALLFALLVHAAALVAVRIPSVETKASTSRSLIVHLSAVADEARAPATEPRPASPASPATAAAKPTPPTRVAALEQPPIEDSAADPRPRTAPTITEATERARPEESAVDEVDSREVETAAIDDSTLAPPTDRAAVLDTEVRASYEEILAAWLRRHRQYPMHLRRRGVEGDGALRLRIDRTGNVTLARMETPIGDRRLDELTMAMVDRAAPFPHMPEALSGESFECVIDIRYRLGE